ncbi:hypothetical protein ZD92_20130 [Salmonella enterica subsp. enterica]|nr:hypothetical protein [Salmonella enterica]ECC3377588.1 hypothetical protein [Salmonella enterica subsp. enterica]EDW3837121.1 hypothetical protein [Salmonella enterica subsp. enterica]
MSTVTMQMKKVWFSPSRGRHFLTRRAAVRAEAHAKILAKYPIEKSYYEHGGLCDPGYSIQFDEPDRYQKMLRRMMRLIDKNTEK